MDLLFLGTSSGTPTRARNVSALALLEARQMDITPFCLTVDRQGHDYLRTMAGDMGYEVLPDVMDLPSRLPYLYRRLTL